MAIPRKGSRKITVSGETYRWLIRRKATISQTDYGVGNLNVAVEHATANGATLHIESERHPHPRDWGTYEVEPITPSDIARWISLAIEKGWDPKSEGPTFKIHDA